MGRWVTIEGRHVYIDNAGNVEKGHLPDETPGGHSEAAKSFLGAIEKTIVNHPVEHAYVVDSGGQVLFTHSGDASSVDFTGEQREKMAGNILTHNHPVKKLPLSLPDLQLANLSKLSEIRAVIARSRTVSVMRTASKFHDEDTVRKAYSESRTEAYDEDKHEGEFPSLISAAALHKVAARLGWSYHEEPLV